MLSITIAAVEQFDEIKQEFVNSKEQKIHLEHSLVSISKWESKWQKPFLSKTEKTIEETIDYVRCMTITQNVDPHIYNFITSANIQEVTAYIEAPMTATTINNQALSSNRETITAEIIYYQMVALNIPFECQKWHLNRLLTLINVTNIKNGPQKKMGRHATLRRNASLNAARRKQLNTRG